MNELRNELTNEAAEIRQHHEAANTAARTAIDHALAAGALLGDAKARIKHGEFETWVRDACGISVRNAQRYMRLHRHRESLPAGAGIKAAIEHVKSDTVSHLKTVRLDEISNPFYEIGPRPEYLPEIGKAAAHGDMAGKMWFIWEDQAGYAHSMVFPFAGDDDEAIWTKRPIRVDLLDGQLQSLGLDAANEREWLPIGLDTVLKIREIAAA